MDRGWVYVFSNPAMPGIVKVGYTSKHPKQRAQELSNTGVPAAYKVEFFVEVDSPYYIEQRVHARLGQYNVGKEWFRCSVEVAAAIIKDVAQGKIYKEDRKHVNREKLAQETTKIEEQRRQREFEERARVATRKRSAEIEQRFQARKAEIETRYKDAITAAQGSFCWIRFGCAFAVVCFFVHTTAPKLPGVMVAIFAGLITFFFTFMKNDWYTTKDKAKLESLISARDKEINAAYDRVFSTLAFRPDGIYPCRSCGQKIRVAPNKTVLATCPKCGVEAVYP